MAEIQLDGDDGDQLPAPAAPAAASTPGAAVAAPRPALGTGPAPLATVQRMPPADLNAEAATLGACLLGENEAIDKVLLKLSASDFYKPAHQAIYDAILDLRGAGQVVDLVSLQAHLHASGQLEHAGGPVGLVELTSAVASASNVEAYARIVLDAAQLRRLLGALQQTEADIYQRQTMAADVIDTAGERILAVAEGRADDFSRLGEGWEAHFHELEASSSGRRPLGLATCLKGWNRVLGGIIPGKVYVIAARPGEGKSTLALNLAHGLAAMGHPAAFFSLEMGIDQMRGRIVASMAEIDGERIETGRLSPDELELYRDTLTAVARNPLHFYHDPYMPFQRLLALARVAITKMRCRVLFIDYLQMLHDDSRRWTTRAEEITSICRRLAAFARAHKVAIIEVAQLNRDLKEGQEPAVPHLKESGGIEEAADVVALLYDKKDPQYEGQAIVPVLLIFGKQRGGDRGRIELEHARPYLRFSSREP